MSSVAVLWVASSSPNPDPMTTCGLVRAVESSRVLSRCQNQRMDNGRRKQTTKTWTSSSSSSLMSYRRNVVSSSVVASHAGEIALSSEEKVYNVVLRQAALVNKQLRSTSPELDDVKKPQDIVLPGSLSLLGEAYDRCGEVCAEYAKTFYLG